MRLIDTETGRFVEFFDLSKIPPYAALSHTWEREPVGEQSYQQVVEIQRKFNVGPSQSSVPDLAIDATDSGSAHRVLYQPQASISRTSNQSTGILTDSDLSNTVFMSSRKAFTPCPSPCRSIWDYDSGLSDKVRRACEIALRDGYRYMWIDSCCIDKTSSSELSEAINSMFNWYSSAQVCYAFLSDVPSNEDLRADGSKFRESRWFTRAWTLQELIAPRVVVFFSQTGKALGTKDALANLIQEITYIDREILTHEKELADESIAQRMRWASRREATRVEDKAYSLLGIFGITMPTLYGEGAYAFRRLQEAILQRIPDQSLFAWGSACLPLPQELARITIHPQLNADESDRSCFAPSPKSFDLPCGRIVPASGHDVESLSLPVEEYTPTPHGIRTRLCFVPLQDLNPKISVTGLNSVRLWHLVIFGSQCVDDRGRLLAKLCYLTRSKSNVELLHVPDRIALSQPSVFFKAITFTISLANLAHVELQPRTVYLPHPKPSTNERRLGEGLGGPSKLSLAAWTRDALQLSGFTVSDVRPDTSHSAPDSHSLVLSGKSFDICIRYRHMFIYRLYGTAIVIEARVWISSSGHRNAVVHRDGRQHYPPYASAVWADRIPCPMTLPLRSIHLVAPSGDEVILQLGLGLTAPSQYHVRVDIATDTSLADSQKTSTQTTPDALRAVMQVSHTKLTFTLLGSVKRALEMQGYSVVVEETSHTSHPCVLTIFDGVDSETGFKVTIKYFHMLQACTRPTQELIVVARITLESDPVSCGGSETYQDGPYVVVWTDFMDWASSVSWRWSHGRREVILMTPAGEALTLHLGLDLAWQSEYYTLVNIERRGSESPNPSFQEISSFGRDAIRLCSKPDGCAPRNLSLTLPGQVKRTLQARGYEVRFERAIAGDLTSDYHLTLSDSDATIGVEYSYRRSTAANGQEKLAFQVRVEALASPTAPDNTRPASKGDAHVVEWDAWDTEKPEGDTHWGRREGSCRWNLPRKEVSLTLPNGHELSLRLGFYPVWLSEYCLIVDVSPH